jgi:hypothetical protein
MKAGNQPAFCSLSCKLKSSFIFTTRAIKSFGAMMYVRKCCSSS